MLANFSSASFLTATGVAISPNASVEVRLDGPGGGALAPIFSDVDGAVPIVQPGFQADATGRFSFYAAGRKGGYQITVTKAGGGESHQLRHQAIGTAAERDVTDYVADQILLAPNSSTAVTNLGLKVKMERAERRARHFAAQNYV